MIQCGTHDDYEDLPRVPMIIGIPPKRQRIHSLAKAISGAAEAVAKAFPQPLPVSSSNPVATSLGRHWHFTGKGCRSSNEELATAKVHTATL